MGEAGPDDLVNVMWESVGKTDRAEEEKLIRWNRRRGTLSLEVVTKKHMIKSNHMWIETPINREESDLWSANGSCSWFRYSRQEEYPMYGPDDNIFNPNAFL